MSKLNLDAEAWAELSGLLDAALDLPPQERDAWLDSLSPRHPELRLQLQRLLGRAAQVETDDFLRALPQVPPWPGDGADRLSQSGHGGDLVGPYRLIRELGRGGMGEVWLAERADGMLQRAVALKLPHVAGRQAGLAERMAREREILASLTHPHIARLYDAGVTPDGQPYLALEYVEGTPIDQHCRERSLALTQRLRLFLQVADAVAYAHAKLVVHRDLKPSNVLVTEQGEVRLLDFGIAKLLDQGRAQATQLTQLSGVALTPDYASPEQILGQPLTIGSDVYSLGVILYELISGARPYRLKRDSRALLEEAVLQSEPPRPSDVAERTLRRGLRGDLDTIALKSLKKKPQERYATVHALADDIERFLSSRPVLAQADSAGYRVRKFVQRHTTAVIATTAVFVASLAGAAAALWQARVALAHQQRAEQVRDFVGSIFQSADPFGESGRALSAVELLRQARARVDSLGALDAAQRVELLNMLGSSMLHLQDTDGAEQTLRQASTEARALGPLHVQSLRTRRLFALDYMARGLEQDAKRELEDIIPPLRQQAQAHPEELVAALLARTQLYMRTGAYEDADASARDALQTTQALLGEKRPETVYALLGIAYSNSYLGHPKPQLDAAKRAYTLAEKLYPPPGVHPTVNEARLQYAISLTEMAELDAAVDLMRQGLRDAEAVFGPNSQVVGEYSQSIVEYLSSAGYIQEARETSERAARILEPLYERDSIAYAQLLDAQSNALLAGRRGAAALPLATRAREIVLAKLGAKHEAAFVLQVQRARALAMLGQLDEAQRLLREVVQRYELTGYSTTSAPLYFLGVVTRLAGDAAQAERMQRESLAKLRPGPRARRSSARNLVELGLDRLEQGDFAAARSSLEEAVEIYREKFRTAPPQHADALIGIGRVALAEQQTAAALSPLLEADRYWRELDPTNRWAGEAAFWLGRCYLALGRSGDAREAFSRAENILAQSPIPMDRKLLIAAQASQSNLERRSR